MCPWDKSHHYSEPWSPVSSLPNRNGATPELDALGCESWFHHLLPVSPSERWEEWNLLHRLARLLRRGPPKAAGLLARAPVNTAGIRKEELTSLHPCKRCLSPVLDETTETQTKGSGNSSRVSNPMPVLPRSSSTTYLKSPAGQWLSWDWHQPAGIPQWQMPLWYWASPK